MLGRFTRHDHLAAHFHFRGVALVDSGLPFGACSETRNWRLFIFAGHSGLPTLRLGIGCTSRLVSREIGTHDCWRPPRHLATLLRRIRCPITLCHSPTQTKRGLTMLCSEPGHRVTVAIVDSRGPGR